MRLRHLAAAAVALTLAAGLTPGASAIERDDITPRSAEAIDTDSRSAVRSAYKEMWRAADERRPRWVGGDVKSCATGRLANGSTSKQLGAINFARRLAGLKPVGPDVASVPKAQAAAIMMTAQNAVNHYPPKSWPCWTQAGYDAAGMSNLYRGIRSETNADKIENYLDDWGDINFAVGHRRWFLYPPLTAIGLGGTATANVSYLFGRPFNDSAPNPEWVSWPSAGWFPNRLDPARPLVALERRRGRRLHRCHGPCHPRRSAGRGHRGPPSRGRSGHADPGLGDARKLAAGAGRQGGGDGRGHHHRRDPRPGRRPTS
ncbi:CAP domain-containing protein [Nocardioides sp. B-3]|uniref:CAP domain-containing protein n=1 Tax=Nocardioides sp. B-3 TaxID=2895565 RepID=UPI002152EB02|nr:CAP domain-containing protein [Nocardioides sp. B-3]UUZ60582.1 CAP domain-containing protein [Nocardioides sp. B-3]